MLSDKESCHLHFYLSVCVCVRDCNFPWGRVSVCVCGLSHCNNYNLSANCRRYWLNHITYRLYSAYIFLLIYALQSSLRWFPSASADECLKLSDFSG